MTRCAGTRKHPGPPGLYNCVCAFQQTRARPQLCFASGPIRATSRGMEPIPYLGQTIRRWQIGSSTFLAWPEAGARLMHWSLTRGDGSVREVIHWPTVPSVDGFAKIRGGNPILFPFCARVFDAGQIHRWRDPQGVVRPMPMHGFARQGSFRVTELNETGFDAVLLPDEEARAAYPYEYEFKVRYRFTRLSLSCEFALTNLGSEPLPWSAGHHFYFAAPWTENHRREDYTFRINAARAARQDATGAIVGDHVPPRTRSLADPDLVDTLHLKLKDHACSFGPKDGSETVTVRLGTAKVPPPEATVVTWSPDGMAPFYCVEPWMGPPNAPEHRLGLHSVAPGQQQHFCVEVLVH